LKRHTLLIWAGIVLVLPLIAIGGIVGLVAPAMMTPEGTTIMQQSTNDMNAQYAALAAEATRVYAQGSYGEILALRLQELSMVCSYSIFMAPSVVIMFLLGLYAGKRGIFHNPSEHLPFIRKVALWGLIIGLPLNVLMALNYEALRSTDFSPSIIIPTIAMMIGAPLLCFAYIGGLTLLLQREIWRRRLAPLAAAGRMALTNYLVQSIICTTIFYSYGLGLYGQIGPAVGLLLSIAIFALQLPFSMWWLSRFQYGPFEWLWRTLTYLRPQPMIKQRAAQLKQEPSAG
jgi:uncharacterized protein